MYLCIYVSMCLCVYVCMCAYTYVHISGDYWYSSWLHNLTTKSDAKPLVLVVRVSVRVCFTVYYFAELTAGPITMVFIFYCELLFLFLCMCPSVRPTCSKDCVAHKTFHRYTVRAKRGTVQSARDGKHGAHQPRSAGASLRRYNEAALEEVW